MKIIGLDVGTRRIGVAVADSNVKIAVPKTTITVNNGLEFTELARIARANNTDWFVVGMPRNNHGQKTAQSDYVQEFASELQMAIPGIKVRFQDETLTSVEAEARLKARKRNYQKAEIDAEAATIILEDFITNLSKKSLASEGIAAAAVSAKEPGRRAKKASKSDKDSKKGNPMLKKLVIALLILIAIFGVVAGVAYSWYQDALKPVYEIDCPEETDDTRCEYIKFSVESGSSLQTISDNLEAAGIIKSSIAFQIYTRSQGLADKIKVSGYELRRNMSAAEVADALVNADNSNVFSFTILPGETISEIKAKLQKTGYFNAGEINAAFAKDYRGIDDGIDKLLESLPATTETNAEPLEGYLYGDTYEFYKTDSVEEIIITALKAMWEVVAGNDLIARFAEHDLTLHQGITLASIVQKESGATGQPTVAQVFYSRLAEDIALGSDVTTQYALDLIDPNRETYTDNNAAVDLDSPYNTRKNKGLPPGPICNPGVSAILAVANPSDTTYLYFLTGDDGLMYYSYTEEEHIQNIHDHCQELCNVSL